MSQINFLAVLVAAASSFVIGGLWYSPMLFGNVWQREAGDGRKLGEGHPAKVFGTSFAFALLAALVYAWLMPAPADAVQALVQGVVVGAGIVAASFGINYQFANRSATLLLIDGGYHTVQFALYGLILGLWR
ncbi:MAG TPA: DUF1761 domain-containing protein [Pseudomonadales bacterium]